MVQAYNPASNSQFLVLKRTATQSEFSTSDFISEEHMTKLAKWTALTITVLFALSILGAAQTQITTGVIQGTTLDATGALVSGASVEVKNPATNFTKTSSTGADGRFTFLALPPGTYEVKAAK